MNHPFYKKTKRERRIIQLAIALPALVLFILATFISITSAFYLLAPLVMAIILSVIAPFFDTPAMRKNGRLIYYSPLFLSEKEKDGLLKIHGGTLLDYVFVLDRKMSGKQRTRFILQQYLKGLLNLLETYEHKEKDNLKLTGTSYIINHRTAHKIGFSKVPTDFVQKVILSFNYFNLLLSNSIAKAKISFPNINRVQTFETDLKTLRSKEGTISALSEKLEQGLPQK